MGTKAAGAVALVTFGALYYIGTSDHYKFVRAKEAFAYAKDNFTQVAADQWSKAHKFDVLGNELRSQYLTANTTTTYSWVHGGGWGKHGYETSSYMVPHSRVVPGEKINVDNFVGRIHSTDLQNLQKVTTEAGYNMQQVKQWIHNGGVPGAGRSPYPIDPDPTGRLCWWAGKSLAVGGVGAWVTYAVYNEDK